MKLLAGVIFATTECFVRNMDFMSCLSPPVGGREGRIMQVTECFAIPDVPCLL